MRLRVLIPVLVLGAFITYQCIEELRANHWARGYLAAHDSMRIIESLRKWAGRSAFPEQNAIDLADSRDNLRRNQRYLKTQEDRDRATALLEYCDRAIGEFQPSSV